MKNKLTTILVLIIVSSFYSCKKFVEVEGPSTSVSVKGVYENDATATGALTSLYVNLSSGSLTGGIELTALSSFAGLSADELTLFSGANNALLASYYQNKLVSSNFSNFWTYSYQRLYLINEALEGITKSQKLTPTVKSQLLGEAKFMRAFYYFYLVNLYGDVPLVLSTDYKANALIFKSPKALVYDQILTDLKSASELLNEKYVKGDGISTYSTSLEERVRPNKWAAIAMLARVYLFTGDWGNASSQADLIIANKSQYDLVPLDNVFLKNNKEAIWQLQPTIRGNNAIEAATFILLSSGPSNTYPFYLSNDFIDGFEVNDNRKTEWIGNVLANNNTYYYPYKYKVMPSPAANAPISEYSTVMRLAEQYLISAEAKVHLGNLQGAISELDKIRSRAGLPLFKDINPDIDTAQLLDAIMDERRFELFAEWGHRWFDLKRTNKIDEVMKNVTPSKSNGGNWESYQQLYPIYINEVRANPNLIQTPGY